MIWRGGMHHALRHHVVALHILDQGFWHLLIRFVGDRLQIQVRRRQAGLQLFVANYINVIG